MNDNDSIDARCPHCQQLLRVPATAAGKRVQCPDCNESFEVPAQTGFSEEPPRPRRRASAYEEDPYDRPARDYDDDDDDVDMPVLRRSADGSRAVAPAICMLIVAVLGLLLALFGVVFAVLPEQPPDPNLPPFFQNFIKESHGPVPALTQAVFGLLSVITIVGSIQMLRLKSWGLGLTACILSMVNIGNCCCILGLPFGIWGMIVLMNPEVKDAFR